MTESALRTFEERVVKGTTRDWKPEYERGGVLGLPPMPVDTDSAAVRPQPPR